MPIDHRQTFGRASAARTLAPAWQRPGWKIAGVLALLCSTVAWASLPRAEDMPRDAEGQWQALGVAPIARGGVTGMPMAPTQAAVPIEVAPKRVAPLALPAAAPTTVPVPTGPIRIRGRVGDGLYWSLRAAGASPQVAAQYLAALATEIDVGDVMPEDSFD